VDAEPAGGLVVGRLAGEEIEHRLLPLFDRASAR